jgi:hypothetical protein
MELTEEQIKFLDRVCPSRRHWKLNSDGEVDVEGGAIIPDFFIFGEIPVKFGNVRDTFNCSYNNLTTLKNCPASVGVSFYFHGNNLTDYFKSIKEEDFPHWKNLEWLDVLREYPFLVNIGKKYMDKDDCYRIVNLYPLTKLYLE